MNYGELKSTIARYLHRSDLTADIPGFIAIGESRIYTVLKSMENEGYATLAGGVNPQDLPADYASTSSVQTQVDRGPRPLEVVTPTRMSMLQGVTRGHAGGPRWFTVQAKQITVWPFVVDDAGAGPTLELVYWRQLAPLVAEADTNDVLTRWPSLYIYAALVEAYFFTGSPSARAASLEVFGTEIETINTMAAGSKWGPAASIQAG